MSASDLIASLSYVVATVALIGSVRVMVRSMERSLSAIRARLTEIDRCLDRLKSRLEGGSEQ